MLDLIFSLALWSIVIGVICFAVTGFRAGEVNWKVLAYCLGVYAIYMVLLKNTAPLLSMDFGGPKRLNLEGKLLAAIFMVAVLFYCVKRVTGFASHETGFTLKQRAGSVVPACLLTLGFLVVVAAIEIVLKGGKTVELEPGYLMAYGLLAGLDEELMYRGFLASGLCLVVGTTRVINMGTAVRVGGIIALVLFALIHGFRINDGALVLSVTGIGLTFLFGCVFLWLRERTGSLLFPVLSHSLANVVALFV